MFTYSWKYAGEIKVYSNLKNIDFKKIIKKRRRQLEVFGLKPNDFSAFGLPPGFYVNGPVFKDTRQDYIVTLKCSVCSYKINSKDKCFAHKKIEIPLNEVPKRYGSEFNITVMRCKYSKVKIDYSIQNKITGTKYFTFAWFNNYVPSARKISFIKLWWKDLIKEHATLKDKLAI